MKGIPLIYFVNRRYTKGYLFCEEWDIKGLGGGLGAESPLININFVEYPPGSNHPLNLSGKSALKVTRQRENLPVLGFFEP